MSNEGISISGGGRFDDLLQQARDYTGKILAPVKSEVAGIFTESIGEWRLHNRVKVLLRAKELVEERHVVPDQVARFFFVPLIEEASNTDDDVLSEMFSRLLANHLDPATRSGTHVSFAKLLGQLGPVDAKCLVVIHACWTGKSEYLRGFFSSQPPSGVFVKKTLGQILSDALGVTRGEIVLALDNLDRLGLIESPPHGGRLSHSIISSSAVHFMRACQATVIADKLLGEELLRILPTVMHREGFQLDKAEITDFTERLEREGLKTTNVRMYLSETPPKSSESQLLNAIETVTTWLGFTIKEEGDTEYGSWFHKVIVGTFRKLKPDGVKEKVKIIEHGLETGFIQAQQSQIDKNQAEAVLALATAMEKSKMAALQIGSLLFVKVTDDNGDVSTAARTLTIREMQVLNDNPQMMAQPATLLAKLDTLCGSTPQITNVSSPPPPRLLGDGDKPQII